MRLQPGCLTMMEPPSVNEKVMMDWVKSCRSALKETKMAFVCLHTHSRLCSDQRPDQLKRLWLMQHNCFIEQHRMQRQTSSCTDGSSSLAEPCSLHSRHVAARQHRRQCKPHAAGLTGCCCHSTVPPGHTQTWSVQRTVPEGSTHGKQQGVSKAAVHLHPT